VQITRITPSRRTILQFSQIRLTLERTFINHLKPIISSQTTLKSGESASICNYWAVASFGLDSGLWIVDRGRPLPVQRSITYETQSKMKEARRVDAPLAGIIDCEGDQRI